MNYLRGIAMFAVAACCYAGPVGVDGILGVEWAGITPKLVQYDAGAPVGNFGTPTNGTNAIGYNIYLRSDSSYVYGFFETLPALGGAPVGNFVNVYFDVDPSAANGSDLGFEVNNLRAFIPGVPGYYDVSAYLTLATGTSPMTTEFALPISFFTNDPLGMNFPATIDNRIVLRLSQSFGFSVAGGASYGADRLGSVSLGGSAPEPATFPLIGLGIFALMRYRRHRG